MLGNSNRPLQKHIGEKHAGKAQEVQLRDKVVHFDFVMTF